MAIKYAILGILSIQPQTGYDLKKRFTESAALYWSGNNNQIYRTLSQLLQEHLASKEVQLQEKAPTKSIYTITEKGRAELKNWILSVPEPPEYRSTFLIRLMWAGHLEADELDSLLAQYEQHVEIQLLLEREKSRRGHTLVARTPRDSQLWNLVTTNILEFYEWELNWVRRLREEATRGEKQ